jgi:uncharacterized peroxidase-related enzyme
MTHVKPLAREQLGEMEPVFRMVEASMGFVPNSMLTMAHWPALLQSFNGLGATVLGSGEVDPKLKQLVAFVVSNAAGCRYCQAHTAHTAEKRGISDAKIAAAFDFEQSPLFSEPERAALRVALHAGMVPNAVEPSHMAALAQHFTDKQIVEIVGVMAFFGFLNRWNDTMATTLEDLPSAWGTAHLADKGWSAGKHEEP